VFGSTHDDRALWSIAAFVKKLPVMIPEEYAALDDTDSGSGHSD
jgi:hypothetical protein